MASTSEPAPGSLMASAPTHSPEISLREIVALLLFGAETVELIDERLACTP